jgi:large subunit ribosomal protein L24e
MPTCSFCKKHYEFPKGLTVFLNDGKTVYFCSSKCQRNLALKRDPRKTNWVKRKKKEKTTEKPKVGKKETTDKKEEEKQ